MLRVVAILLVLAATTASRAAEQHPNIILFLVDDMGQQDTSVPMLDHPTPLNNRFRTPNLEKLASRGVRFSNAYAAAPVCTPSRTAIMSGRAPARTRITYWTLSKDTDTSSRDEHLVQPDWQVNGLQPSADLLPEFLRKAGYMTIHVGKAHWGASGTDGADPLRMGFDVNVGGHAAGAPGSYLGTDHFKDAARKERGKLPPQDAPASVWDVPGLVRWHGRDIWLDDALAREACDSIDTAVAAGRPFFLSFCPYGVHAPITPDPRFAKDYPGLDGTERAYASMVAAVDDALGRIVARCTELGVLESTIVVFTSDNGGLSAQGRGAAPDGQEHHTHNAPLRSGKGSAYEGGIRVPFVAAGPGIARRPDPIATPVIGTDLYPTLLSMAGLRPPQERVCDGTDITPLLRGDGAIAARALLFHQPHKWGPTGPGIEPFSAIRVEDWKLIWFHRPAEDGSPRIELYDVAHDPSESRDRAADQTEKCAELITALHDSLAAHGAQFPKDRRTGLPIEPPSPARP
jgi:arylsulfatase A-like enzyme